MKKFYLRIRETHEVDVDVAVEAESEAEAIDKYESGDCTDISDRLQGIIDWELISSESEEIK